MNKEIQNKFESIDYQDLIDIVYFVNKSFQNNIPFEYINTIIDRSTNEKYLNIIEELINYLDHDISKSKMFIVELFEYFSKRTRDFISFDQQESNLLLEKLNQRVWSDK